MVSNGGTNFVPAYLETNTICMKGSRNDLSGYLFAIEAATFLVTLHNSAVSETQPQKIKDRDGNIT